MSKQPELPAGITLPDIIARVRSRLWTSHLLEAAAAGIACGMVAAAPVRLAGWSFIRGGALAAVVAMAVALVLFSARRAQRTRPVAAALLERVVPNSYNVIFTAAELTDHPGRASPWIRQRVMSDADRVVVGVDTSVVVPLARRLALCAASIVAAAVVLLTFSAQTRKSVTQTIERLGRPAATAGLDVTMSVTLEPPAHTGLPIRTASQPDRISAVEGTRVTVRIGGPARPRRIRFTNSELSTRSDGGATVASVVLRRSGYLAIEGENHATLIPVTVAPDRAPFIKVERPGRDLLVPHAARVIRVETTATDDFGLQALSLRYTKASGSGEQFEFLEGEIPLGIARHDSRSWSGRGALDLSRLGLEPGDSLVYRVVAQDARAGDAGLASSDTFFVEVAGPGQAALEGFEMPPDRERHALSQQMIVLRIERLREREHGMTRDDVTEQANTIAAEQRAVRANFVFLVGGHVEDEEEEAEQSHEIQEGRLENTARRDISRAIEHMTLAEHALVAVQSATALQQAKLAVDALQRAFGRNRYILRTLPVRARIDPSRRLTGKLDEARDWTRTIALPEGNARVDAIRDLVAAVVANGEKLRTADAASAALVARLAEQALAVDPTRPEWQVVSARFTELRATIVSGGDRETLERKLQDAVSPLMAEARRVTTLRLVDAGASGSLRGAWAEEVSRK